MILVSMARRRFRPAASNGQVRTSASSCRDMLAIRITLSRTGIGFAALVLARSRAPVVSAVMGGPRRMDRYWVRAPVGLHDRGHRYLRTGPARKGGAENRSADALVFA